MSWSVGPTTSQPCSIRRFLASRQRLLVLHLERRCCTQSGVFGVFLCRRRIRHLEEGDELPSAISKKMWMCGLGPGRWHVIVGDGVREFETDDLACRTPPFRRRPGSDRRRDEASAASGFSLAPSCLIFQATEKATAISMRSSDGRGLAHRSARNPTEIAVGRRREFHEVAARRSGRKPGNQRAARRRLARTLSNTPCVVPTTVRRSGRSFSQAVQAGVGGRRGRTCAAQRRAQPMMIAAQDRPAGRDRQQDERAHAGEADR